MTFDDINRTILSNNRAISGITINMISVFGMILVIGILADDGIVIGENIYQFFEKGKKPKLAAIDGTMDVIPAALTSVSTTIIAFLPAGHADGKHVRNGFYRHRCAGIVAH